MVSVAGHLGHAAIGTFAAPAMGTTQRCAVHFYPLELLDLPPPPLQRGGGTELGVISSASSVNSVNSIVPVRPEKPHGLPCSVALFCSCLAGATDLSVQACQFAPLVPVHVVSPLHIGVQAGGCVGGSPPVSGIFGHNTQNSGNEETNING